jgi:hypothetical protein
MIVFRLKARHSSAFTVGKVGFIPHQRKGNRDAVC